MKTTFPAALLLFSAFFLFATVRAGLPESETDRRADSLLALMTVGEKIGQLNLPAADDVTTGQARSRGVEDLVRGGMAGGLLNLRGADKIRRMQRLAVGESRLGIPLLFGLDVIHGYETIFPIPLALSCTWDTLAVELSARIAAAEASADGICWTFSPMTDICRDARWGRISEGSGEDPFLASAMAGAMVRGYQGRDKSAQLERPDEIMACVKHFALYGAAEAGRDYNTVDMSRIRMYNEYLPPYRAAVDAGAGSVMCSFNEIDGVPATANKWLLTDLLRKEWGFGGFVVTDYTGIAEMTQHGIGDLRTVSARALVSGVDMDMVSGGFSGTLEKSLEDGTITEEDIDRACRRVLKAKYRLGLFDDPYKYCRADGAGRDSLLSVHRAAARKIAAESFVLLKNSPSSDGGEAVLPLKRGGKIAVIGPLADNRANMFGSWSPTAREDGTLSLFEGLKAVAGPGTEILYAKGSNLTEDAAYEERATVFGRSLGRDGRTDGELLAEALETAAGADVVVAALGESSEMTGESSSRSDISLPDVQRKLLEALLATGKPVVLALFTGRPLTLVWEDENVPAILNVWFGGGEAALAVGDVLFGDENPSGKLTVTFPKSVGQIPLYYNHKNTGRPLEEGHWFEKFRSNYLDIDNEPLYPFGYGLSYTAFEYGNVTLDSPVLEPGGRVTASVTVTNTGGRDGAETVELYVRDLAGSVTRPVKELKGFERIFLKAGESRTVSFEITPELLSFWNYDLQFAAEPGEFDIMTGPDSRRTTSARLTLVE